ncbi:Kelch repeat-containing protein [Pyxidicoccus trucidator]|uniref:Kelch repeat-containing protein n=1 Tax=Pyxidicoccus trucidator TaxID=2709662 RepID=UPI0013D8F3E6|nr:kelch motif-containing protein [Pyxidicoccus trucidator]
MTRVSATKTWLWLGLTLWSTLAAASGWSPAASMSRYRYSHTATLLPSGKVLITGGGSSGGPTATTETYTPATNTWAASANLSVSRSGHTATRLPSGRVLIAGGSNTTTVHASAEEYNHYTNTFTAKGALVTARRNHQAVLLHTGQVLVVAGYGTTSYNSALKSAELYTPSTGQWTATGSLSVASGRVTATVLDDGRVLVVNDDGAVAAAEVYSPSSGTWTQASAPPAFFGHAAVKLDSGAVLATGQENFQYESGAWLYWPEDDYWEYVAYANETRRRGHSLTLLPSSGRVLVARGTRNQVGGSTELFDPNDNGMYVVGQDQPTTGHTATLLPSGQVLVVGGTSQEEPEWYSSAELFTEP